MGYRPSVRSRGLDIGQVLFLRSVKDRHEVEVNKHAKKERGYYPAILSEQAWLIKDLIYYKVSASASGKFFLRDTLEEAGFFLSCPPIWVESLH